MVSLPSAPPPAAIIFLDVEGVLISDINTPSFDTLLQEKLAQLFGGNKEDESIRYTPLQRGIACSHFFSKTSITNLEKLIDKVSKVAKVSIVIHSSWREKRSVEELRDQIFAIHPFSKLIIDKTPDPRWLRSQTISKGEKTDKLSAYCMEKYGFELTSNKGVEIDFWLRENQEKLNVQSCVVLEDAPDIQLPKHLSHTFVRINDMRLISEADIEKAYEILTEPFLKPSEADKKEAISHVI